MQEADRLLFVTSVAFIAVQRVLSYTTCVLVIHLCTLLVHILLSGHICQENVFPPKFHTDNINPGKVFSFTTNSYLREIEKLRSVNIVHMNITHLCFN